MAVEKSFKKPLARQIREGVAIEMSKSTLMNSKSEWNNSRIPRIIIEEGEKQVEDTESGLGNQKERDISTRKRNTNTREGVRNDKRKVEREQSNQDRETEAERGATKRVRRLETEKTGGYESSKETK